MSLQVQSSQQPPSGRRTPQIYQNFSQGSSTSSPNNGNSKTTSSKLSLKAASEKPAVPAPTEPIVAGVNDSAQTLVVSIAKLPAESKEVSAKDNDEKVNSTNGSNTNGTYTEKTTNGKPEETTATIPGKTAPEPTKKEDEKEKKLKQSPRSTPQKPSQLEQASSPKDTNVKKTKESSAPVTPDQKMTEKPLAESSLIARKTLKGLTSEGEEMESLVVEPSEYEDSPMPPRTGGKSKLLKYGTGPLTKARMSPFRVNEANKNASTIVNLSTVSEGQISTSGSNVASPASDYNRPLRTISGRRSTRPLSDIQLTYRRSADPNDSTSSLNVTIGSEIHDDSLSTPASGSSRKRKAMTPESTSDALDVKEIVDSPKRGRLDLSGLLGIVSSPVTLLKNRLSRVRLQASTPVAKRNFDIANQNKGGVVTAEATTTTTNVSDEDAKMEVEAIDDQKDQEFVKVAGGGDQEEQSDTANDNSSNVAGAKDDGSADVNEPVVVKDITNKQRQFCVIM